MLEPPSWPARWYPLVAPSWGSTPRLDLGIYASSIFVTLHFPYVAPKLIQYILCILQGKEYRTSLCLSLTVLLWKWWASPFPQFIGQNSSYGPAELPRRLGNKNLPRTTASQQHPATSKGSIRFWEGSEAFATTEKMRSGEAGPSGGERFAVESRQVLGFCNLSVSRFQE